MTIHYEKIRRLRVNRHRRCPMCQRDGWCLVHPEGIDCICPRTPSATPIYSHNRDFVGYLHILKPGQAATHGGSSYAQPEPPKRRDLPEVAERYRTNMSERQLGILSRQLDLTSESLLRLCVGWCTGYGTASFPMRNELDSIIGIQLRTEDGEKFCLKGSSLGLFIPTGMHGNGPLVIEEGASSTGALLDFGFDAIGRPSSSGGVWLALQWIRRNARRRDVVILGNHDEEKKRPDGSTFFPGQEGADRLAQELIGACRSVKVVIPPYTKDARAWKQSGATRQVVEACIRAANYVRKVEP